LIEFNINVKFGRWNVSPFLSTDVPTAERKARAWPLGASVVVVALGRVTARCGEAGRVVAGRVGIGGTCRHVRRGRRTANLARRAATYIGIRE
jgi:hypothetical protein